MSRFFYYALFLASLLIVASGEIVAQSTDSAKVETQGKIHCYKGRYIIKEKTPGELLTLLENSVLEQAISELQPFTDYVVQGQLHHFQGNRYLLASHIEQIVAEKKSKKTEPAPAKNRKAEPTPAKSEKAKQIDVAASPVSEKWPRKVMEEKVEQALRTSKGPLANYRIAGDLRARRIEIAEGQARNFNFTGELIEKSTGKKMGLIVKVKNSKSKVYTTESKEFIAGREQFKRENGYSQMIGIFLAHSEFSNPAQKYLQENNVYIANIRSFVDGNMKY